MGESERLVVHRTSRANSMYIDRVRLPSIKPRGLDYDPRDNRVPTSPISPWMGYFNLLRSVFGAGLLGMPSALSNAGIILGPWMSLFTGFLLIHSQKMLLNCLTEICRQLRIPHVSYRYGFRLAVLHGPPITHAIGDYGPAIVGTYVFLNQLGICTVFVSLTSDSVRDIMDWQSNRPALFALLFPYLLLEFFMKTLKIVSYVSLLGNMLNLVGLSLIVSQCLANLTGDLLSYKTSPMGVMVAFGIFLFNMSAVAVILAVDRALKEPRLMLAKYGIVNVGILIPCLISTAFGIVGYWSFGTGEENILRSLPLDEISSIGAISLYLVAVAFAYPIQCYPAIAVVLEVIKNQPNAPPTESLHLIESVTRPTFVILSFILCYLLPFQTPLVAFVGNMCTSMLTLVFPAFMDLCLRYPDDYGAFNYIMFKDIIIFFMGMTSQIFGVFECSYLIYTRVLEYYGPPVRVFY
ncbi:proton-coupled amino acid transporter-like protein CG1139 [Trichoplusia ni]|uniref:Proton-coupled amino acid transporter-like protein CG1139 n=1 Tax=Trichoplusia ni TaxID=7111 RepID=A0A7E5WTY0_TRINI|nr:proton-coupled amino acid transporter-like protein CG1139 [Trichoplusia ni]